MRAAFAPISGLPLRARQRILQHRGVLVYAFLENAAPPHADELNSFVAVSVTVRELGARDELCCDRRSPGPSVDGDVCRFDRDARKCSEEAGKPLADGLTATAFAAERMVTDHREHRAGAEPCDDPTGLALAQLLEATAHERRRAQIAQAIEEVDRRMKEMTAAAR